MPKPTKIGEIRSELRRIASDQDRENLIVPTMLASWSFEKIVVLGNLERRSFDFESLKTFLKIIPSGAGEKFFWNVVRSTDFDTLP